MQVVALITMVLAVIAVILCLVMPLLALRQGYTGVHLGRRIYFYKEDADEKNN